VSRHCPGAETIRRSQAVRAVDIPRSTYRGRSPRVVPAGTGRRPGTVLVLRQLPTQPRARTAERL